MRAGGVVAGRKRELVDKTVWRSDPHLQVKHLMYKHYLQCWMGKVLQSFPQGATIVDAFAGPGIYEDGPPGSPIVIARTFLEHSAHARFHNLHLICLEERADRVAELNRQKAALGPTPKLRFDVLEPGSFAERQADVAQMAHAGDPKRPVLWILDPFGIRDLSLTDVLKCLNGRRDEALITFFVNEMNRLHTTPNLAAAMTAQFGSERWRQAVAGPTESARKTALVDAYGEALKEHGLLSGRFAVQVSNHTARYYVVLATHSEKGLECWAPATWKLDRYGGTAASASSVGQESLFESHVDPVREALAAHAGSERTWAQLVAETKTLNYLDKHLRTALDQMAAEGLAFRVHPVKSRSPWPDNSIVRFYAPEDLAEEDPQG